MGPYRVDPLIVEDEPADPVALGERAPSAERREFGRGDGLHGATRAEEHVDALVNHEKRRPVLLLGVDANEGLAGARGHPPVHGPDIVAREILPEVLECEAAPTQPRGMAA